MEKIKDYPIKYDQWLNVQDIMHYYQNYGFDKGIIITDNGTGKTYTATNWVCEVLALGCNCCWIRNTELEADKCVNGLRAGLERNGMSENFVVNTQGIHEIISRKKTGTPNELKLRCPIVYMSSLARSVPQEIHAELIVIDEFIDGSDSRRFILKDYAADLKKAISRLIRPVETGHQVLTLALANPHQPTSDLLYALGIDFDWDLLAAGKPSFAYNLDTQTFGICIPKQFNIKEMESTYSYWKGTGAKENYKFLSNEFKRVHVIPDDCVEWQGRFTSNGCMFAYGWWDDTDGNQHMYVRKCDPMELVEFKAHAATCFDTIFGAIFTLDMRLRASYFYKLINASLKFNCYYDSDFTQETVRRMHIMAMDLARAGYM